MTFLSSRTTLAVLACAICIVCAAIYLAAVRPIDDPSGRATIAEAHVDFAYEVRDERQLAGAADNVFVGRVVERIGTEELPILPSDSDALPGVPETRFRVEVERNLKGNLGGVVEVSQDGGRVDYVADRGADKGNHVEALVVVEHDPLMSPGQRYVFVTTRDQQRGHNQIVAPGYGNVPAGEGPEEKRLRPLVEKFAGAIDEQIDPETKRVPTQEIPPGYLAGEDVPN